MSYANAITILSASLSYFSNATQSMVLHFPTWRGVYHICTIREWVLRCFSTNFDVSTNESSPTYVRACICESPKEFSLGWYCLAFVDITSNLLRVSARFFLFFRLQHEIHVSEVMVSRWFWQIGSKNVASSRVTTFSGGKKTLGKQNVSIWFHLLKTFTFEIAIR